MTSELPQDGEQSNDLSQALGQTEEVYLGDAPTTKSRSHIVLAVVVLLAVVVAVLLYKRGGPKAADATTVAQIAAADKTITSFLGDGESSMRRIKELVTNTEKVVEQFRSYPNMKQVPISDLQSNPFCFESSRAQLQGDATPEAWRRAQEAADSRRAANDLQQQLQSIMYGGKRSSCMINNTLYLENQTVEGFTIDKIEPNGVIVSSGTHRFRLRMGTGK